MLALMDELIIPTDGFGEAGSDAARKAHVRAVDWERDGERRSEKQRQRARVGIFPLANVAF